MCKERFATVTNVARTPTALRDSVDVVLGDWRRVWPSLPVDPVGVIGRLHRVRTHIDQELEVVFAEYGLTNPSFQVLTVLRRRDPPYELNQRALMDQLGLTSGTVSVRIDRLVHLGLVERRPDPADKRGAIVVLTDTGITTCETVFPHHLANEDRLLSALTPSERDQLAELLRKLLIGFEGEAADDGEPVRLGVALQPAHVARAMRRAVGLPDRVGLLVRGVIDDTPAAHAELQEGDLLVAADSVELRSIASLHHAITNARRRSTLRLTVVRGIEERTVDVRVPNPRS